MTIQRTRYNPITTSPITSPKRQYPLYYQGNTLRYLCYVFSLLSLHPFTTSSQHRCGLCFHRIVYCTFPYFNSLHPTHNHKPRRTSTRSESIVIQHSPTHRHFTTAQEIAILLAKEKSPVASLSGEKSHLPHFPTSTVTTCSRSHVYLTPVLSSSGYEVIKIALRKHEFCTRFLTYLSIFLDI